MTTQSAACSRPLAVYASVILQALLYGLIPFGYFFDFDGLVRGLGGTIIFFMPILWIGNLYVAWEVFRGSQGVRIPILVSLVLLSATLGLKVLADFEPWYALAVGIGLTVELVSLILLFLPSSNRWFAECSQARLAKESAQLEFDE